MASRLLRWAEFVCMFVLLPLTAFHYRHLLSNWLLPLLCLLALLCLFLILNDSHFKRFRLTNYANLKRLLWYSPVLFAVGVLISVLALSAYAPEQVFVLPTRDFYTWCLLLALYPLFSVIPQELIFRTYLFHRFKGIMPSKTLRIWVSAAVFALAHIIYANWIAVVLAFVGGLMFAYTYASSRSTAACVLEHSLWGLWLFTLGAGQYLSLVPQ